MKIGLIADIHGNSPAFQAVLASLRGRVDSALFMGDLAGYYPFVNECVEEDEWEANQIIGILGNHDQVLLDCLAQGKDPEDSYCVRYGSALTRCLRQLSPPAKALLASWPQRRSLTLGDLSIAMFHGAPWLPLEGRAYPDFTEWERFDACAEEVILLGHTHYPMIKNWRGKMIINPGSVGQPRSRSGAAEFGVLDTANRSVVLERVPYDVSRVVEDARRHDPQMSYLVEVLGR